MPAALLWAQTRYGTFREPLGDALGQYDDPPRALQWFGALGFLRRLDHHEVIAVDGSSGAMVRIVSDEVEELTEVQLPETARFAQ